MHATHQRHHEIEYWYSWQNASQATLKHASVQTPSGAHDICRAADSPSPCAPIVRRFPSSSSPSPLLSLTAQRSRPGSIERALASKSKAFLLVAATSRQSTLDSTFQLNAPPPPIPPPAQSTPRAIKRSSKQAMPGVLSLPLPTSLSSLLSSLPSSLSSLSSSLSSLLKEITDLRSHPIRTLLLSLILTYAIRPPASSAPSLDSLGVGRLANDTSSVCVLVGPPKHLIMDNRGDMEFPITQTYRSFKRWHEKYGPVISFWLGRKGWVSLGTIQAATDLLEKRGAIYSSRPKAYVTGDILTRNMRGLVDARKHEHRSSQRLPPPPRRRVQAPPPGHPPITLRPGRYQSHLEHLSDFVMNSTPGKFLVDIFPILSYLPKPLQWWRPEPERHFQEDSKLLLQLMNSVRDRMAKGLAYTSTATRALEKQGAFGLNDLETAFALNAPFGAGAGTTLAQLDFWLLAMLLHPEVMKKAQEEVDRVVGRDRLPEWDDESELVYVKAVIRETMRWRTIAPMGVPHCVIEDDVYEGCVIPKGTTVIASIYTMTQDPTLFPEPDAFKPERYLEDPSLPYNFLFGFGRRLCPGMHVAQNSLFMVVSKILWAFDVLPPLDASGKPILPDPNAFIGGIVIKPVPFEFVLKPREGKNVESVVLSEAEKAEVQLAAYD
ncbi:hypothetical protein NMY22_g13146 [Coprinellus aureogranulatus]|nr:hypothetical protein NMY22_g13146 [Coprinellus aureogranulatus]